MKPKILSLDGLNALTDETGILQHTKFSTIDRRKGYTTDDNARALIAVLRYHEMYKDPSSIGLADKYLTFLLHMQKEDGRFHNLLGFDRAFKDEVGSEDCMGNALWASGYTLNSTAPEEMKIVAKEMFDRGLPPVHNFTSPRAKALTLIGLHHYNKAFPEDRNILKNVGKLASGLVHQYRVESDEGWCWFESYLTYSNPRLPQALFSAFESTKKDTYLEVALNSFNFLIEVQMVDDVFVPVGTKDWYIKKGEKALYDQQPIEASCMVEAAIDAYKHTRDERYLRTAENSFEWYHGKNVKSIVIYNEETGTCYDGITNEGLNLNQGAESTLSYYLAYLIMKKHLLV